MKYQVLVLILLEKVEGRHLARVLFGLLGLFCLPSVLASPQTTPQSDKTELLKQDVFSKISELEEQDFARLERPMPGDWLHAFPEPGQSVFQFKMKDSRRLVSQKRSWIVLQPLGDFTDDERVILDALQEYSQAFFQLKTRIAKPLRLTDPAKSTIARKTESGPRDGRRGYQYEATGLVNQVLLPRIPNDAVVYLGITMEDLYAADLNFVFGFGSFENRIGVYSLARYFPEFWNEVATDKTKLQTLRRSLKVLNHETSHVFGLRHCIFYDCTMNGSNSLEETDRTSIHECPVCHQKLMSNLQFEPRKRFEALQATYIKLGLLEEAAWIAKRKEHWLQETNQAGANK